MDGGCSQSTFQERLDALADKFCDIFQEALVKHKVLADGVEALLGAYLQAGDLAGAWALLAALNILPIPEQANYPVAPDEGAATTSGPSSIKTREVDKHPPAGDQGGLGRAG